MPLWTDSRILIPGLIVVASLLGCLLVNYLSPYDPNKIALGRPYAQPSLNHRLGLDNARRDILSRILHGGRLTLGISISSVFIAAFVESEPFWLILVIALLYTPRFMRVAYATVQTVKHHGYVEAARALGAPVLRILRKEIIPNILAPILVQISLGIGLSIILETGLSFVGLGPPPPAASWGRMIEEARRFMRLNAMILVWPALVIGVCVVAFNMLGDALRDHLDPRLRHDVSRREEVG